ncbi:MAG: hypothetical protein HOQ09_13490, partial [Gemmatimonadaceae bacterium]|nr:hypothetical protein [Gemmatimonadaceae bacterium]
MTQFAPPLGGFNTRPPESLLAERAGDFLAAGPASAAALIASICQLPGVPAPVAEHMAATLFAGRREFTRGLDGLWCLTRATPPYAPPPSAALVVREPVPEPHGDPIDSLSYTVVDVETIGSSPERGHRITEIAAVRVERGEIRDVFQ